MLLGLPWTFGTAAFCRPINCLETHSRWLNKLSQVCCRLVGTKTCSHSCPLWTQLPTPGLEYRFGLNYEQFQLKWTKSESFAVMNYWWITWHLKHFSCSAVLSLTTLYPSDSIISFLVRQSESRATSGDALRAITRNRKFYFLKDNMWEENVGNCYCCNSNCLTVKKFAILQYRQ